MIGIHVFNLFYEESKFPNTRRFIGGRVLGFDSFRGHFYNAKRNFSSLECLIGEEKENEL